ncbi:MAG: gliding motility-associated lipoprotein GldH [Chitinophagales bacterium]|jgi:gliding motility-associated lipoprotein GldH
MPRFFTYTLMLLLAMGMNSCDELIIFEKDKDFKEQEWMSSDTLQFEVSIEDQDPKNLYINVRHRFNFNWRNIWLNLSVTFPNDSLYELPINIPLSQPDGQWFGDCSGDLCRLQYPLAPFAQTTFGDTGKYVFRLSHEMREDPLLNMLSAGIRIEQVKLEE